MVVEHLVPGGEVVIAQISHPKVLTLREDSNLPRDRSILRLAAREVDHLYPVLNLNVAVDLRLLRCKISPHLLDT